MRIVIFSREKVTENREGKGNEKETQSSELINKKLVNGYANDIF